MPQAIRKFLYFNDIEIITSVHRCMLLLLPIIDGPPPVRVNAPSKVSQPCYQYHTYFTWLNVTL